jgi:outer membrane protein assembly factor BamB
VEPPAGARAAPLYAPRTDAAGRAVVYRWSGGLARMGGKESAATLADTAPDAPWAFAVGPGRDEAAVLSGPALRFFRAGARLWQFDSPRPLVCGPALAEDRFIAGDDEGRLVCLAAADGRLLWERRLDEAPRGALTAAAGLVLGASREGTLYAVAPADGAVRWTQALGDLLLVPPVLMGGRLAVASKGNRIVLLEAATGKEAASVQWPTWLVDVGAAGGRLACTDLRGTVTFLDGAALQPLRSVRLGARLQPGLVYVERFPERWGAGRDLVYEEAPALLAADKAGFLYVLSLPGGEVR